VTTRKYSEDEVRHALDAMDLELVVYKPPDSMGRAQNWKPCDFMVWWEQAEGVASERGGVMLLLPRAAWIEVKSTPAKTRTPLSLWRPSQIQAMRTAKEIGLPYLSVIHWSAMRQWTIGPSMIVLDAMKAVSSIPFDRWPIRCTTGQLGSHLRAALLGE
jgi:hypothetical protein